MGNYRYYLVQLWGPISTRKGTIIKTIVENRPEKKEIYI